MSTPSANDNFQDGRRLARANSHDSQTASEFIDSQLQLEADAREALPYTFDHCTQPLGPLRQNIFSCLTCNPPPLSPPDPYVAAGICYSCSIVCHGEHELVELFNHRNFTCDCGTTRLPSTSPCTLRLNPITGLKGSTHSQPPSKGNTYNQNFRNRFCGCGELYDAHTERGTMFQCLGLATEKHGGCGEDWWHPECVLGLERRAKPKTKDEIRPEPVDQAEGPQEGNNEVNQEYSDDDLPQGFPPEEDFETFICYKCVDTYPWIKRYAGSTGFLPPVLRTTSTSHLTTSDPSNDAPQKLEDARSIAINTSEAPSTSPSESLQSIASNKRKAGDDLDSAELQQKKTKIEPAQNCYYETLPKAPESSYSLFLKEDFRDHFCRCPKCYADLRKHPQLLEEEESYEPPLSESGEDGGRSAGTGSLLDRGEAALSNVDRVRAIEGVMVYNHLKDKVKSFLQPFAESGQAVGADDIKAYFEKLRGDEQGMKATTTAEGGDGINGDNRREQSGY